MKENNKLIAEFMEVKFDKGTFYNMGYDIFSNGNLYRSHELKYHESWDWLMPVVEKIMILVMEDDSNELYNSEEWDNITHTLVQIQIKSVYKAVVNFIKEYNQND